MEPMSFTRGAAALLLALVLVSPALAQPTAPAPEPDGATAPPAQAPAPTETRNVFEVVGGDFKRFFSADTAQVLGMMSVASIAATPWDSEAVRGVDDYLPESYFGAGKVVGSFPFQLGAGALVYGVGRAAGGAKAAALGADIMRAQIVSQAFVQALKFTVRRERPDRSNRQAFPSGHSASAFATAAVLHRHFGWRGGVPGYAFGAFVAASRMSSHRHHLSDVIMGAGFGLAAGRTATIELAGRRIGVGVQPVPGGGAIAFSLRQ